MGEGFREPTEVEIARGNLAVASDEIGSLISRLDLEYEDELRRELNTALSLTLSARGYLEGAISVKANRPEVEDEGQLDAGLELYPLKINGLPFVSVKSAVYPSDILLIARTNKELAHYRQAHTTIYTHDGY